MVRFPGPSNQIVSKGSPPLRFFCVVPALSHVDEARYSFLRNIASIIKI